ncbi:MAG: TetR/AcrR family transcriptional regulator [Treponema sp.]|jgi:AcrR family transcriptional regulator|nr:TetR/AcrR family transcriptional regulator [Treponema sp.]
MEKTDIRVQFTRKVLRESLVELMKEKSILNISIREICEKAGVSRSTFYTYYKDQYELLEQMEEETFIELDRVIKKYNPSGAMPAARELTAMLEDVLRYVAGNYHSIQVFLSENGESGFQRKIAKFLADRIRLLRNTGQSNTIPDEKTLNYCSAFMRDGCIVIIQEWLKNGMDMGINDMAKLLARLVRGVLV